MLSSIQSPKDIKSLSLKELKALTKEIRKKIIEVVGKNGGHLSSNLGVVELTLALHRVFDSPEDAIVFDVGHQCYTHKLLTGRYKDFDTLRQKGGLSGFTKQQESIHDFFDSGHASTAISSALGLLTARKLQGQKGKVVAVVGDGALTGGLSYEGLSGAGQLKNDLIVVLNDNQMSISLNTSSISAYLSRLTATPHYQKFRHIVDSFIDHLPFLGAPLTKLVFRIKRAIKGLVFADNFFTDLGFEYAGPFDGHNIAELEKVFLNAKQLHKPIVVHVLTKKGKGYSPAENDPAAFHGVGPFCISDGSVEHFDNLSFTQVFSEKIMQMAQKHKDIVAITSAMSKGTGLDTFSRHYKDRFFDVGIAEEHAVTFAGGLAKGGLCPIVAIYSTFIQRAVDQIIHDIALQNRHVIFCLDRAGAVPYDGATHQGAFDIALLKPVPNLVLLSPVSGGDLCLCLEWAYLQNCPVVIRYPKASCPSEHSDFCVPVVLGRGILQKKEQIDAALSTKFLDVKDTKDTKKVLLVTTGSVYSEVLIAARALLLSDIVVDIYILRFIKPFDSNYFLQLAKDYDTITIIEDGVLSGGVAQQIKLLLKENLYNTKVCTLAFPDKFLSNASRQQVFIEAGLDAQNITKTTLTALKTL